MRELVAISVVITDQKGVDHPLHFRPMEPRTANTVITEFSEAFNETRFSRVQVQVTSIRERQEHAA